MKIYVAKVEFVGNTNMSDAILYDAYVNRENLVKRLEDDNYKEVSPGVYERPNYEGKIVRAYITLLGLQDI